MHAGTPRPPLRGERPGDAGTLDAAAALRTAGS
jgi:hypothetical protein